MFLKMLSVCAALVLVSACGERELDYTTNYTNPDGQNYELATYKDGSVTLRFVSCEIYCGREDPLDLAHDEIIRITSGAEAVLLGESGYYFDMNGPPLEVIIEDEYSRPAIWFARRGFLSGTTLHAESA